MKNVLIRDKSALPKSLSSPCQVEVNESGDISPHSPVIRPHTASTTPQGLLHSSSSFCHCNLPHFHYVIALLSFFAWQPPTHKWYCRIGNATASPSVSGS